MLAFTLAVEGIAYICQANLGAILFGREQLSLVEPAPLSRVVASINAPSIYGFYNSLYSDRCIFLFIRLH
jgi:hypothetical protein